MSDNENENGFYEPESESVRIRLWFISETKKARFYSKLPLTTRMFSEDSIWIPKSIIEHTTKRGNEHEVTLPDWFIRKNNL